jgi:metallo-beta-lactamase family protein
MPTLQFLGATGTVTGSKFLLEADGERLLVDCGLFQGEKSWRLKNWETLAVKPSSIQWIVLTHAHLDHIGYLPRIIKDGFRGEVVASSATVDLAKLVLPDSGHLQEEDAAYANFKGYSKHKPALPLYTYEEAVKSLELLRAVNTSKSLELSPRFALRFYRAGHILGARMIEVTVREKRKTVRILFSGDLGRFPQVILPEPEVPESVECLLVESTYGDRLHPTDDVKARLAQSIESTSSRGGTVLIPSFAVGRTQELLYLLREMIEQGTTPSLPIHVDSPMAIDVTDLYRRHRGDHDLETAALEARGVKPFSPPDVHFDRTPEESKALNDARYPMIIISASGMATGGRVLHHLERLLPDHRNTVLFVGFQAQGTRGRAIRDGAQSVKMHGREVRVRARVECLDHLSAHADYGEILGWLKRFSRAPRQTFLVHGEPGSTESLRQKVAGGLRWKASVPEYFETVRL